MRKAKTSESHADGPARASGKGAAIVPPPAEPVWDAGERAAWLPAEAIKPSEWAERHRRLRRGPLKGPWRNDNAPYSRGIMDIADARGIVQVNVGKAGQMGVSELLRTLMGYWAHTDPDPMGLTLPNRDKGRQIVKSDVLPLFRRTAVLRDLIASMARHALIESISLLNGFSLDLMWSGSATSMASNPYRRVVNDEVDKFEPWTGEEPDAIAATEVRITTFGDRRLQINVSTPTTTAGTIHALLEGSTVKLYFHVPCPHCGHWQTLRWPQMRWLGRRLTNESIAAAQEALKGGQTGYAAGGARWDYADTGGLVDRLAWLTDWQGRMAKAEGLRDVADLLASERETAVWYQCEAAGCGGRIHNAQKAAMVRRGRWMSLAGPVGDYWGQAHEDAEKVERWPNETRVGFHVTALHCLWIHWGTLASEWLRSQKNPAALFFFVTNRLGEPFEFRMKRTAATVFAEKCQASRGAIAEGVVPEWAWTLLATIDTQADGFYVVIRAWGGGMRSARVWHGRVVTFDELDRLIFVQQWPVAGENFPPMTVARALIDSGGTADRLLDASRTQQVYTWAAPRQPIVTAIKGASRPGAGLYWPMRSPMREGGKAEATDLRALMVDTHQANDLLSMLLVRGTPGGRPGETAEAIAAAGGEEGGTEAWLCNLRDDPEYNQHMAAVQKTVDPKTRTELWTPRKPGTRHDYRDCEAYQVVAAYVTRVHQLPAEDEVVAWKRQEAAAAGRRGEKEAPPAGGTDGWAQPL